MKPQNKVKIKWSPEFAYAIGLLTTDGNLSPDGRHLNFTSKDKELTELLRDCLGIKNTIGKKGRKLEGMRKRKTVPAAEVPECAVVIALDATTPAATTAGFAMEPEPLAVARNV